ncbi:MAG: hypothetical protein MUP48_05415, partial [Wolbachia endosymbiont of Homalodisca vitripennis]|nr:hypothetical protein [Wolbachia endosymbiont of Homalodisca vitripennis]MCJ7475542.1 hypothetical protein [Wolbachia endosymbiont of Homalodisca vitripennis]
TMLGKLIDANKVLKVDGSNATDPGVNTMLGKLIDANKVLKVDGSNATDPGVTAMLGKLTLANQVVKIDGSNATDAGVTAMLGKLTDKVVKTSELSAKAAEKPVVDAITASADFTNKVYIKAAPADEVYTKTAADAGFVKIDGSNATDPGVTAMLGKLTGDNRVVKFDGTNADNILRGLAVPTADDVANVLRGNTVFVNAIKAANAQDVGFQKAVQDVMLQSNFEIPTDPSAPLSWDW